MASITQLLLLHSSLTDVLELWIVWKVPQGRHSISHSLIDMHTTQSWIELSSADDSLCLLNNINWMNHTTRSEKDMDSYYSSLLQNSGLFSHTALLDHIVPFSDPIDYINNQPLAGVSSDETPLHERNDKWLCLLQELLYRDEVIYGIIPCSLHIHKEGNSLDVASTLLVVHWYRMCSLQFAESCEIEEYEDLLDNQTASVIDIANLLMLHITNTHGYPDWNNLFSIQSLSDPEVSEKLHQFTEDSLLLILKTLIHSLSLPSIASVSSSSSSNIIGIASASFVLSQVIRNAYTLYHRSLPLFYLTLFLQAQFPRLSEHLNEMKRCCMEVLLVIFFSLSHV